MSLQMQRHTVFGFSHELDWRLLHFIEPIPAHRICDVCGLLPRTIAFLPCGHVLCRTCFEQCLDYEAYECPLDGEQFRKGEADWIDFPVEDLLRCKVKCWNEDNGCDVIVNASGILKHFAEGCAHHSMRCPNCSALVLRRNVCAHRRSKCSTHALPNQARQLKPSQESVQEAMFTNLKTTLEECVREMNSSLEQVLRDHHTHYDRLNEVSPIVSTLEETVIQASKDQTRATNEARIACVKVKEDLAAQGSRFDEVSQRVDALDEDVKVLISHSTSQFLQKLEQTNAELRRRSPVDDSHSEGASQTKSAFEDILGKTLERGKEAIVNNCDTNADFCATPKAKEIQSAETGSDARGTQLLALNILCITRYGFCVKGIRALKEKAIWSGWVIYDSEPIHLCGYRISPGLYLKEDESCVSVHTYMQLHKGMIDECLQWPFPRNVKLTVMHSSSDKQRELFGCIPFSLKNFGRPTESCNRGFYWYDSCSLEDLEREGYVESDQLCVML